MAVTYNQRLEFYDIQSLPLCCSSQNSQCEAKQERENFADNTLHWLVKGQADLTHADGSWHLYYPAIMQSFLIIKLLFFCGTFLFCEKSFKAVLWLVAIAFPWISPICLVPVITLFLLFKYTNPVHINHAWIVLQGIPDILQSPICSENYWKVLYFTDINWFQEIYKQQALFIKMSERPVIFT